MAEKAFHAPNGEYAGIKLPENAVLYITSGEKELRLRRADAEAGKIGRLGKFHLTGNAGTVNFISNATSQEAFLSLRTEPGVSLTGSFAGRDTEQPFEIPAGASQITMRYIRRTGYTVTFEEPEPVSAAEPMLPFAEIAGDTVPVSADVMLTDPVAMFRTGGADDSAADSAFLSQPDSEAQQTLAQQTETLLRLGQDEQEIRTQIAENDRKIAKERALLEKLRDMRDHRNDADTEYLEQLRTDLGFDREAVQAILADPVHANETDRAEKAAAMLAAAEALLAELITERQQQTDQICAEKGV